MTDPIPMQHIRVRFVVESPKFGGRVGVGATPTDGWGGVGEREEGRVR